MKKLFISTLSLLMFFTAIDRGMISIVAEETESDVLSGTELPAETTSEEEIPTEETPAEESEGENTPTEETPAEESEGENTPTEETPAQETLPEEAEEAEQKTDEEAAEQKEAEETGKDSETEENPENISGEMEETADGHDGPGYMIDYDGNVSGWCWPEKGLPRLTDNYIVHDGSNLVGEPYKCPSANPIAPGFTFLGWSRTKDGPIDFKPGTAYDCLTSRIGSVVRLYGVWRANEYKLDFRLNGGAFPSDCLFRETNTYDFVSTDTDVNLPVREAQEVLDDIEFNGAESAYAPVRKGYVFAGFYYDSKCTRPIISPEDAEEYYRLNLRKDPGSYTLYARWDGNVTAVTYELNGGTEGSADNPAEYVSGTKVRLRNPSREGYHFVGWYMEKDFSGSKLTELPADYEGSTLTLYARWAAAENFRLSYNTNGAEKKADTIQITLDETPFTLKAAPHRAGYEFTGWNTAKNGSGKAFSALQSVTAADLDAVKNKTVTLYAQWKELPFTITYENVEYADNTKNPESYTAAKKISLKNPVWAKHTFAGWYDNPNFRGKKVTAIAKGSEGDITLYAKWTEFTYSLSFNANGGTGAVPASASYSDSDRIILPDALERDGYEFLGWNTAKSGKGTSYAPGSVVSSLASKNKGKVTLYAQWNPITYTVTFSEEGVSPITYTAAKGAKLPKLRTKDGKKFDGWYMDEAFASPKITSIAKGSSTDCTLYAKWVGNDTFKIVYKGNGYKGKIDNTVVDLNQESVSLREEPTWYGYEFVGWSTKQVPGIEDRIYSSAEVVENPAEVFGASRNSTVTLYAQWNVRKYTITFWANAENAFFGHESTGNDYEELSDGYPADWDVTTGNSMTHRIHEYNKAVSLNFSPIRPGYRFAGWSRDKNAVKAEYLPGKKYKNFNPEGTDVELFAVWK